VIGWPVIGYGAALTAVAALLALLATGDRRRPVLALGVLAGAAAPVAWNAILRATHAAEFFTDAPLAVLPASWQDTGSGCSRWPRSSSRSASARPGGIPPAGSRCARWPSVWPRSPSTSTCTEPRVRHRSCARSR